MNVPTATSLKDIYPEDAVEAQVGRWERLLHRFKEEYGEPPGFVARSPGRVNLIGEVSLAFEFSLYDVQMICRARTNPGFVAVRF